MDPQSTSPNSIMPGYPWLYDTDLDVSHTEGKIITMQQLGVPYESGFESKAVGDLQSQATGIAEKLTAAGIKNVDSNKEIIALIAYLQRLGTDIKVKQ
jgi:cytochrome c oxidase cbb3-type subunit I/II